MYEYGDLITEMLERLVNIELTGEKRDRLQVLGLIIWMNIHSSVNF